MSGAGTVAAAHSTSTVVHDVGTDVLLRVLQLCKPRTMLHARQASSLLDFPGAAAVEALEASSKGLPLSAWQVFPNATILVLTKGSVSKEWWEHGACTNFFAQIPVARVRTLRVTSGSVRSTNLPIALAASSLVHTLQTLEVSNSGFIYPAAADALMQSLPALRDIKLHVRSNKTWKPKLPQTLERADLTFSALDKVRGSAAAVDLASLNSATTSKLQHLSLTRCKVLNISTISALTSLRSLTLQDITTDDSGTSSIDLQMLQGLTDLRSLCLPNQCVQGAEDWLLLASLPLLQELTVMWAALSFSDFPEDVLVTDVIVTEESQLVAESANVVAPDPAAAGLGLLRLVVLQGMSVLLPGGKEGLCRGWKDVVRLLREVGIEG